VSPSPSLNIEQFPQLVSAASTAKANPNAKPKSKKPQSSISSGSDIEVGGADAVEQAPMEEVVSEDVAIFVPDLEYEVGSSKRQYIIREKGEKILAEWKRSGQHMAIFDETLDKMHIEFSGKIAADTLKRYLKRMRLEEKYDLLLELICEKYPLPEERMKGIELLRIYQDTFGTDALLIDL
jgi:hypothetical protein